MGRQLANVHHLDREALVCCTSLLQNVNPNCGDASAGVNKVRRKRKLRVQSALAAKSKVTQLTRSVCTGLTSTCAFHIKWIVTHIFLSSSAGPSNQLAFKCQQAPSKSWILYKNNLNLFASAVQWAPYLDLFSFTFWKHTFRQHRAAELQGHEASHTASEVIFTRTFSGQEPDPPSLSLSLWSGFYVWFQSLFCIFQENAGLCCQGNSCCVVKQ